MRLNFRVLRRWLLWAWLCLVFGTASCSGQTDGVTGLATFTSQTAVVESPNLLPSITSTATATLTSTPSPSETTTQTPTEIPTETALPEPSQTPTPPVTPTYAILRGQVQVRSNCRYGPGAPYLYKYGLVPGSNLEVIGRNDLGTWIVVRAIGGTNPCWVKADLMEVKGEVMAVEPTYLPLPQSPYYGPLTGVSAIREGDEVTVFWNPVQFRAGDETASPPYLVEAWVCLEGQLVFTPVGAYEPAARIRDEAGCEEPSHGRAFLVEKHGYTQWVEVPWPHHP